MQANGGNGMMLPRAFKTSHRSFPFLSKYLISHPNMLSLAFIAWVKSFGTGTAEAKLSALMNFIQKHQIIGKVSDFVWRIEYQKEVFRMLISSFGLTSIPKTWMSLMR
jgi:hypothetical protein